MRACNRMLSSLAQFLCMVAPTNFTAEDERGGGMGAAVAKERDAAGADITKIVLYIT